MNHSFPEPRAWAPNWEGTALFPDLGCASNGDGDRQEADKGWALQWQRFTGTSLPRFGNGNGKSSDGLSGPLGWALKWDGAALVETSAPGAPASLRAAEYEREDTA